MSHRLIMLLSSSLLILTSCGEPERAPSTDDAAFDVPSGDPFARGKSDRQSCDVDQVDLRREGSFTLSLNQTCRSIWLDQGEIRLDSPSRVEVSVKDVQGEEISGLIALCMQRHEYFHSPGLNLEHPRLANWEFQELLHEGESPCGWFSLDGTGGVKPVNADKLDFSSTLKPGYYSFGLDRADREDSGEWVVEVTLSPVEPARCGDGVITGEEQCDDGNHEAMDTCGASCTWNRSFISDRLKLSHDTPETAYDLGGFQHVSVSKYLAYDEQDEWLMYVAPEAGTLQFDLNPNTNYNDLVRYTVVHQDTPEQALATFSPAECEAGICTVDLDEAGTYLIEVSRSTESSSRYGFDLYGTPFAPAQN